MGEEMHEKKRVPAIRFAGFTEPWEQRELGNFIIEYTEVTTENNQYPALTSSRKGIFLQADYFSGNQIASEDNTGYNIVPYGYFTYRHMSDDEIFYFNINNIVENGIVSTLYPVFTTNIELDSKYLQYQLNHGYEFAKFARLQKQGGSRTYMYLNKLKKLRITIPLSVKEQKSISKILLELDRIITLHQRKCDALKKVKKSLLQKMFPKEGSVVPEIRFAGFTEAWEQRKLEDIFKEYSEKNHAELPPLTIIQGQGTILRNKSDRHLSYDKESLSGYKFVKKGDFIVHLRSFEGGLEIAKSDGIISPAYHTLHSDVANSNFYYPYFRSHNFINNKLKNCVYGIRDGKSINLQEMKKIKISYTNIREQECIAKIFTNMDNLITLHQRKLDQLKTIKKSLLQQMFV